MTRPEPCDDGTPGRFAYEGLERVIHEKARLSILASLVAHREGLLFSELKELCALTDGNLNRHLAVLQDAGLIEVWKGTAGKRPQTLVRMTEPGRQRFLDYLAVLERIIADAARATVGSEAASGSRLEQSWSPV